MHHQDVADVLYGGGLQPRTDFGEEGRAFPACDAVDAHLDQFMGLQTAVDFGKYAVAQAMLADADDRTEAMGAGAKRPAQG